MFTVNTDLCAAGIRAGESAVSAVSSAKSAASAALAFPIEYEFESQVSSICNAINSLDTSDLSSKLSTAYTSVTNYYKNDPMALRAFETVYNSMGNVINEIDFNNAESLANGIGKIQAYTSEEIVEEIVGYYSDKNIRGELTEEEKAEYEKYQEMLKEIKNGIAVQNKYDVLQDLYQERENGNDSFDDQIENLEKDLGIYEYTAWDDIKYAVTQCGAEWYEGVTSLANGDGIGELLDAANKQLSTNVVVATSAVSGVFKLGEWAQDALVWAGGTLGAGAAHFFGADGIEEWIKTNSMDFIARDRVGEKVEYLYTSNPIGEYINENSNLKFDSKGAKGIRDATGEAVLIAGATAATVATGGAAAPALFAVGAAVGAGQSAEEKFQDKENRDFYGSAFEIALDGTIKGLSTVAYGKAGAMAYNGVKTITKLGLTGTKEFAKETLSAFNKQAIKSTIKNGGKEIAKTTAVRTIYDKDTLLETAAVLANDVKSGIKTGKWDITRMILDAALIYGENYLGNLTGDILSDSVAKIDRIAELYQEGQQASIDKYNVGFKSYREHAEKHVYYVADYMQDISKNVQGINTDETLFGSLAHDLGMKGGYVEYNGKYMKADDVLKILESEGKKIDFDDIDSYVRKPHPLNSALTVLTDDIIPYGVDKDVVALLAMSHSKSTSGISYFDNPNQWNKCIDDLADALKQYNIDNGTDFKLDTEKLKDMINNPDEFKRLQKEALIIRDGDAMSKVATVDGNTIMQTGNVSEVINHSPRKSYNDVVASEKIELSGLSDNLKTVDGEYVVDGDVSSGVKYHVGELNTKFSSKTDGTSFYKASVDLVEPNQTPHSTLFAIQQRIGEVNTYSNCSNREFVVNLPKEAEGTELGNWYKNEVETNLRNKFAQKAMDDFNNGIIDTSTKQKQLDFYSNIRVNFE